MHPPAPHGPMDFAFYAHAQWLPHPIYQSRYRLKLLESLGYKTKPHDPAVEAEPIYVDARIVLPDFARSHHPFMEYVLDVYIPWLCDLYGPSIPSEQHSCR